MNSNSQKTNAMGLNSAEKKKSKEKNSTEPSSGRNWPFKRSKSKNKTTDALHESIAVDGIKQGSYEQSNDEAEAKPGLQSPKHSSSSPVKETPVRVEPSEKYDAHELCEFNTEVDLSNEEIASFCPSNDRERMLLKHVKDSKAKCVQIEKTMRWWSDCTANWREKWGKVRAERNKLKEETKIMTGRNEALTKELANMKQEIEDHILENQSIRNELSKCKLELKKLDKEKRTAIVEPHMIQGEGMTNGKMEFMLPINTSSVYESTVPKTGNELQFLEQILSDQKGVLSQIHENNKEALNTTGSSSETKDIKEYEKAFGQKTRENIALRSQLEQMRRFIQEREKKYIEMGTLNETLTTEITKLKEKTDEKDEISTVTDVSSSRIHELKMKELRAEIERLQKENAEEWNKREEVETDKQSLEREIKRLKAQIEDLEEEIRKKTDQVAHAQTTAMKFLQEELENKSQELLELRLTCKRVQKQLQEKSDELEHEKKRTEQYEIEMKKLRCRVEELKKKLCASEENADNQSNIARRLQRTLEEQCQHSDNLQSEIDHLSNRLKRQSLSMKSKTKDGSDDEAVPL